MSRWAVLAALGVLSASGSAGAQPFSLTVPAVEQRSGPLVLAVVDHGRERPNGRSYCVRTGESDGDCWMFPVYQGSVEIVRYLSPRPRGWRHPSRFPQVMHPEGMAVRSVDPGMRLEILGETADGQLASIWSASAEDDLVCLPQQLIEDYEIRADIHFRSRVGENGEERCFLLSDVN